MITTDETEIRPCKYVFTDEEMREIAGKLAAATQELEDLENEKKAVASSYKERIDHAQLKARRESRRYRDGYEIRNIECRVLRNYDDGTINYVRTDNGESVLIRPMTAAEKQMRIQDALQAGRTDEEEPQDQEVEDDEQYEGLPESLTKYLKDKRNRIPGKRNRKAAEKP